jgi:hypothetical protein
MDIQNQKQVVINKRFELNQQIKTYRNLLKNENDLGLKFRHLVTLSDLKEERIQVNFIINKFDYIKNFFLIGQ